MYLFQLNLFLSTTETETLFTFHHVSISTGYVRHCPLSSLYLHSTMYLFQHSGFNIFIIPQSHLHSTMYLFQPKSARSTSIRTFIYIPPCIYFNSIPISSLLRFPNLHSTMYLFQRPFYLLFRTFKFIYIPPCIYFNRSSFRLNMSSMIFTFHHVSISTVCMTASGCNIALFTFHHVSISTVSPYPYNQQQIYLHSTMYLFQRIFCAFNHLPDCIYIPPCIYFNCVSLSIKSTVLLFTFHHVSISTISTA